MTELQTKELELLREFIRICDELHLTYYLVCGSALGAVKYQGFIPWDDDVDVGLPREDYEVFLREAQARLPDHLFLQNYRTDPAFPHLFSKLRSSATTYVETGVAHLPMNHGVYLDIFPLDGYPERRKEQRKLEKQKEKCQKKLACVFERKRSARGTLVCAVRRMLGHHRHTDQTLAQLTACISQYPTAASTVWCNHGNWQGMLEYAPREQYGAGTQLKFEGLTVRVPERYDEYLRQKYGDYTKDLPAEERVGHHFYEILDLERPYTHYCGR